MSVDLKPCPFCGEKAVAVTDDETESLWGVMCISCGGRFRAEKESLYEAIEVWNRRTASVNCEAAETDGGGCLGYSPLNDDEPIERCKYCEKYTGNRRGET